MTKYEQPFARSAYPRKHPYGERAQVDKTVKRDAGRELAKRRLDYYLDHPIELLDIDRDPFFSREARRQYALHIMQGEDTVCVYLVRQDGNVIEIINSDDIPEDMETGMGARNHRYYYFDQDGFFVDSTNREHNENN